MVLFHLKKKKKIDNILALVNLTDAKNKRIGKYSRGMKQRIGIAANIIRNPKILLLDEPVSALDPIGRKEIINLINNLKGKITIVFSTHVLDDIEKVCDSVIIIDKGKLVTSGTIKEIRTKYLKNMIEVQFMDKKSMQDFKKQFKIEKGIQFSVDNENFVIKLINHDLGNLQSQIFEVLSKNEIIVMSLKIITPTLEEIFMNEVSKK